MRSHHEADSSGIRASIAWTTGEQQLPWDRADIDAVVQMAPTDEKTKVVLPEQVPNHLPLPSDQKRPVEELKAEWEPLWKTTRSA